MAPRPITAAVLGDVFTAFNTRYRAAFAGVTPDWMKVATEIISTAGEEKYTWLGDWPAIRKWIGDRLVRELAAHKYSVENEPYETTVRVKRDNIEDDQLGIYGPMFDEMGRATASFPDELVFALLAAGFDSLCYDGQPFFDTDHPVGDGVVSNMQAGAAAPWFLLDFSRALRPIILQKRRGFAMTALDSPTDPNVFMRAEYLYGADGRFAAGFGFWQMAIGSKADLDPDSYEAARVALGEMKSDEGRPLGIKGGLLVVPPSLEGAALDLLKSERNDAGATNKWRGTAEVLVCPWLA